MTFTQDDFKRVLWTFAQAFLGGLIAGIAALGGLPSTWDAAKAAGLGLVVGAIAAGISAVKNLFLVDGTWAK
jgi:hypothetical protein